MTKIINGKLIARNIYQDLLDQMREAEETENTPSLAVILVGDNAASQKYVAQKQKRIESLGLSFKLYEFLPIATPVQIIELIEKLNEDKFTHGILVQLPLPKQYNAEEILNKIDPAKDVDGLTGRSPFKSPTACAIMEILQSLNMNVENKKVIILGKGKLVGTPFYEIAKAGGLQVEAYDESTEDIAKVVKEADIIISATGHKNLITKEMVSEHQTIIDAGIFVEKGVQFGDADYESIKDKVAAITPPKGGVGPVTIACLVKNLMQAYKNQVSS